MTSTLPQATDADPLRARLGKGARFDAPGAPAQALRLARHGMAFFARQLNALSDEDLARPSRVAGWSRAHVVAAVSIAAREQALLLTALRGQPLEDEFDWQPDVDFAATLPARALRHLYDHAHVHLNVEWRDLASDGWARALPEGAGTAADLPARHAAQLWWGAMALGGAASARDIPGGLGLPDGPLRALAPAAPAATG